MRGALTAVVVASLVAVIAAAAVAAPAARADGDPASDVLLGQPIYVPADAGVPPAAADRLAAVAAAASRSGYPVRVALIATPADLGSVSQLWGRPQAYAAFLGQELSLVYRGVLVVVMPGGLGLYHVGPGTPPPVPGGLLSLRPGRGLAAAGTSAVLRLAAADGHRPAVPAGAAPEAAGSSWLGSVDAGSWLALGFGAAMIALTWGWSLRARPPARRRRARYADGHGA